MHTHGIKKNWTERNKANRLKKIRSISLSVCPSCLCCWLLSSGFVHFSIEWIPKWDLHGELAYNGGHAGNYVNPHISRKKSWDANAHTQKARERERGTHKKNFSNENSKRLRVNFGVMRKLLSLCNFYLILFFSFGSVESLLFGSD